MPYKMCLHCEYVPGERDVRYKGESSEPLFCQHMPKIDGQFVAGLGWCEGSGKPAIPDDQSSQENAKATL